MLKAPKIEEMKIFSIELPAEVAKAKVEVIFAAFSPASEISAVFCKGTEGDGIMS